MKCSWQPDRGLAQVKCGNRVASSRMRIEGQTKHFPVAEEPKSQPVWAAKCVLAAIKSTLPRNDL